MWMPPDDLSQSLCNPLFGLWCLCSFLASRQASAWPRYIGYGHAGTQSPVHDSSGLLVPAGSRRGRETI